MQKVQSFVTVILLRIYLTYSVSENNPVGGHNGITLKVRKFSLPLKLLEETSQRLSGRLSSKRQCCRLHMHSVKPHLKRLRWKGDVDKVDCF